MKNEHENESEIVPQIDQSRHERLCAYVFGELQGDERAAFEAELERTPALREECTRLEVTIGLVKSALPDEGLSAAVRSDVLVQARRSRFRFLGGRRMLQLAAAVVLVVGGSLAFRNFQQRSGTFTREITDGAEVAQVVPLRLERQEEAHGRRLQSPSEAPSSSQPRASKSSKDALLGKALDDKNGFSYDRDTSNLVAEAEIALEDMEALEALGYGGGAPSAPNSAGVGGRLADGPIGGPVNEPAPGVVMRFEGGLDSPALGEKKEVREVALLASQSPSESSVERFRSSVDPTVRGKLMIQGRYRGPGDSVPPGEPAAEADALGIDYLAVPQPVPARKSPEKPEERELLRALGYGGESDFEDGDDGFFVGAQVGREPVLTREQVVVQVEQLLASTRPAPGESPRDMFFRYFGDAPFTLATEERTSSFAVDVDTASYALMRAYVKNGQLPPREAVRTEEFVNYFKADQAPPTDGKPFAIELELAPSLFARDARAELLRVAVRGKDVADFERQPVSLTFVIDVSGSMNQGGRLGLVQRSLALLLRQLASGDSVSIVKFSNQASLVTPMLQATRRGELEGLIRALATEGGTNVEAGLRLGYEQALEHLAPRVVNRVILCSDGVGNIGETGAKELLALVDDARAKGIYLNTVGVGMGNHNDAFLEQLADEGDGVCHYVDSDAEAKRVFVDGLASALQPIARDVKIQVEFDPTQVESWRLLGYENRALRNQDFRNDAIDAGEVNAGHQVSALYELVRHPSRSGPLATVRVRYKPPFAIDAGKEGQLAQVAAEEAMEIEGTVSASSVLPGFAGASGGYQRVALVAQLAEVLRQSVHARGDAFADLLRESRRLEKTLGDPDFTEFVELLGRINPLLDARSKVETPRVQEWLDELSRLHYELALRERKRELARQAGEPKPPNEDGVREQEVDAELKESIERLEAQVRAEMLGTAPETLDSETRRELDALGYGDEDR